MGVNTGSGWKIWIGPDVTDTEADTLAEIKALLGYTEIKPVESIGEFGDSRSIVTFLGLGDDRVRKAVGTADAGDAELVVGHDPLDAGQLALIAAGETKFKYAFKIEAEDAPDSGYTNSFFYFRAAVGGARISGVEADNIVRMRSTLAIDSQIFREPAAVI